MLKLSNPSSPAPLKVEYDLTAFGKTLIPVLEAIASWGKTTAETHKEIKIE